MFDVGWTELLLIGIVALIVIGPKDLPAMFHTLGRFVARAKGMAREFQNAMNDAAKDAGIDDVAKDLKNATSARSLGLDKLQDAATKFENWDPSSPGKAMRAKTADTAGTAAKDTGDTGDTSEKGPEKGPETAALRKERAEARDELLAETARRATARNAALTEAAEAPAAKKPAAKKKTTAKKLAAKKPAAPKTAAKKTAAKKTAAQKPAAKKPAAKKVAPPKAAPKKPTARKSATS